MKWNYHSVLNRKVIHGSPSNDLPDKILFTNEKIFLPVVIPAGFWFYPCAENA